MMYGRVVEKVYVIYVGWLRFLFHHRTFRPTDKGDFTFFFISVPLGHSLGVLPFK